MSDEDSTPIEMFERFVVLGNPDGYHGNDLGRLMDCAIVSHRTGVKLDADRARDLMVENQFKEPEQVLADFSNFVMLLERYDG